MAKLLKKKMGKKIVTPTSYVIEINQEEADMLAGIVADLLDNPQRKVTMRYNVDQTESVPTKRGTKALKGVAKAFKNIEMSPEYWYDDLWEDYLTDDL